MTMMADAMQKYRFDMMLSERMRKIKIPVTNAENAPMLSMVECMGSCCQRQFGETVSNMAPIITINTATNEYQAVTGMLNNRCKR